MLIFLTSFQKINLSLPDLSLLLPIELSRGGGGGGGVEPATNS